MTRLELARIWVIVACAAIILIAFVAGCTPPQTPSRVIPDKDRAAAEKMVLEAVKAIQQDQDGDDLLRAQIAALNIYGVPLCHCCGRVMEDTTK
jgi:hypothetical protein